MVNTKAHGTYSPGTIVKAHCQSSSANLLLSYFRIPFEKGKELAERYEVAQYLIPIFEYDPAEHQDESGEDITPTKDEAMGIRKPNTSKSTITKKLVSSPHGHSQDSKSQEYPLSSPHRTAGTDSPARASSPMYRSYSNIEEPLRKRLKAMSPFESPSRTYTYDSQQEEDHDTPGERHRAVLMSLFLNEDPDHIPDLFLQHNTPKDLNIELVIDDQGHTALHWAAALARLKTLRQLVERGADIQRTNFAGETALMRSVLVTNNYGQQCFSDLLDILFESINSVDQQKRTVLHHMALTAGIPRRATACSYYMNILIQRVQEKLTEDEKSRLLEARDNNGDTALNIAARLGNRKMMITLIKAGADRYAANNVGLKPEDFVNDFKVRKD
jgi:regulatory protein SWI6